MKEFLRPWKPGDPCTLNGNRDLFFEHESRPFIGADCNVVKITKAGLVQVVLVEDPRKVYSAPKYNVDPRPL